ncbi:hypothetical protein CYMTET_17441 [Cymbomonas tetramitiformis]|uniref:Uncharacterized protein n=1 Tax=Cymbomonas tetramitiformis TaxID=36881 RepID=A0AAE0GAB6_9CHLO|nr:hypothetical protein CYMTET_17441 [Cymbomonas tetramitiformis]
MRGTLTQQAEAAAQTLAGHVDTGWMVYRQCSRAAGIRHVLSLQETHPRGAQTLCFAVEPLLREGEEVVPQAAESPQRGRLVINMRVQEVLVTALRHTNSSDTRFLAAWALTNIIREDLSNEVVRELVERGTLKVLCRWIKRAGMRPELQHVMLQLLVLAASLYEVQVAVAGGIGAAIACIKPSTAGTPSSKLFELGCQLVTQLLTKYKCHRVQMVAERGGQALISGMVANGDTKPRIVQGLGILQMLVAAEDGPKDLGSAGTELALKLVRSHKKEADIVAPALEVLAGLARATIADKMWTSDVGGLLKEVAVLHGSAGDVAVAEMACVLLRELVAADPPAQKNLKGSFIATAVDVLFTSLQAKSAAPSLGFRAAYQLCQDEEILQACRVKGVIPMLLEAFEVHKASAEVALVAGPTLLPFCTSLDSVRSMVKHGALETAIKVMAQHAQNEAVQLSLLQLVDALQPSMLKASEPMLLEAVFDCMRLHSNADIGEELQITMLHLLATLSGHHAKAIHERGMMLEVAKAMHTAQNEVVAQIYGCRFIAHLLKHEAVVKEGEPLGMPATSVEDSIMELEVHELILQAMTRFPKSASLQLSGCTALRSLSLVSSLKTQSRLMQAGAFQAVKSAITIHQFDEAAVQEGCRTLGSFSRHAPIREDVVRQGALDLVVLAVQNHAMSASLPISASKAVLDLLPARPLPAVPHTLLEVFGGTVNTFKHEPTSAPYLAASRVCKWLLREDPVNEAPSGAMHPPSQLRHQEDRSASIGASTAATAEMTREDEASAVGSGQEMAVLPTSVPASEIHVENLNLQDAVSSNSGEEFAEALSVYSDSESAVSYSQGVDMFPELDLPLPPMP